MNDNINRNAILDAVAPCAFCCFTCQAKNGGVIEETSKKLNHYLEGYYEFTRRNLPLKYRAYSKKIKALTEQLEEMTGRRCGGCRGGAYEKCCIPNCFVLNCAKSHNVDFCGECEEFPCAKGKEFFKGETLKEWILNNEKIKKDGVEEYYKYAISRSHYKFYV